MNYALGYSLGIKDLFVNFDIKRLKFSAKVCEKLVKNRHKEVIIDKIMKLCIKLVIEDIIHNNATFNLPTNKRRARLRIAKFEGEKFAAARRQGKWLDVDFLASNFAGYQMVITYDSGGITRQRLIYIDPRHKKLLTDYTNAGKQYF